MISFSHLDIGQIGEKATAEYYKKRGYSLVTMNFSRPFGELDVIVKGKGKLIFIEVKSVSCVAFSNFIDLSINPAENIHTQKRARLRKAVSAFLKENNIPSESWQFDVALVQVNTREKRARVELIEDVIL